MKVKLINKTKWRNHWNSKYLYLNKNSRYKEYDNNPAATNTPTQESKNEENGLQEDQRSSEKCGNHQRGKLYRRNHENIKRLCRTTESSVKFKSDPIVVDNLKVANLSKKTFSTEIFQMF